jgi:hypothetical protein
VRSHALSNGSSRGKFVRHNTFVSCIDPSRVKLEDLSLKPPPCPSTMTLIKLKGWVHDKTLLPRKTMGFDLTVEYRSQYRRLMHFQPEIPWKK